MFADISVDLLKIQGKQMIVRQPPRNANCQDLRVKSIPAGREPSSRKVRFPAARGVSIIIPTFIEEKNIGDCIRSVQKAGKPAEIIVVDGGSTDRTREIVEIFSEVRLLPGAITRLLAALRNNPGAIYDDKRIRMRWIEALNRFRTIVSGISFGDQAQFFRRDVFADSFPAIKLMEDIELSLRMKENGALLFIPRGVIASGREWQRPGYGSDFRMVIYLTALYLIKRRFGRLSGDCDDFYRKYYGSPSIR